MNLPVTKYAAANQWCIDYIEQQRAVKQLNSLALQTIAIKKASATPQDSSFLDKIKNIDFGALLQNPAVMAGLGSAAVGGGLTLAGEKKKNETTTGKALRALGNAGMAGLLGGGAAALLNKGTSDITTALPKADVDPTTASVTSPLVRILSTIGGVGAAKKLIANPQVGRSNFLTKSLFERLMSGTHDPVLKEDLHKIFSTGDPSTMRAKLTNLFDATNSPIEAGRIWGMATPNNIKQMENDLRYLNIHGANKGTFSRLKSQLRGAIERGIDLKDIGGIGGRGLSLARGAGGAALGFAMPSIVAAVSKYIQNRE
jgi:hypothetical protein